MNLFFKALSSCSGVLALCVSTLPAFSAEPVWYQTPFRVTAGGKFIDMSEFDPQGHAAPFLADIDGDGRRDLVVGSFTGKFRFFRNVGTDGAAQFGASSVWLAAAGRDMQVPNFCCVAAGPQLVDTDRDGILDLTSGSYYPGAVYWFKGLRNGQFASRQMLTNNIGYPIVVHIDPASNQPDSYKTNIAWMHWDDDGILDLIVGNQMGRLFMIKGDQNPGSIAWTAAPSQPLFSAHMAEITIDGGSAVPLGKQVIGGKELPEYAAAAPAVADWDGDGLEDILVGVETGAVYLFRNSGKPGAPQFRQREKLVDEGVTLQWVESGHSPQRGQRTQIQAVDYNLDGKLDLLMGDWIVSMTPRQGLSAKERHRIQAIRKELAEVDRKVGFRFEEIRSKSTSYSANWGADKALVAKAQELERKLVPFLQQHQSGPESITTYRSHGTVWVLLRK